MSTSISWQTASNQAADWPSNSAGITVELVSAVESPWSVAGELSDVDDVAGATGEVAAALEDVLTEPLLAAVWAAVVLDAPREPQGGLPAEAASKRTQPGHLPNSA
jgi:hypothetical protein